MHRHHTRLLSFGVQVVDGLARRLACRAHEDDDAVGVLRTVVGEELVFAAGAFADCRHILLYYRRHGVVVAVACLAVCEERLGVLGHAFCRGFLRRERTAAETCQRLLVHEVAHVVVFDEFHFLVFVRCAEAVEEVDERHARLNGCEVCYGGEVHHLLHAALGQHGEACLAAGHDVAMVAEDTQRMARHGACAYVEDARQEFAGDLVHVGDHQQQPLRCGERACQRAGLQRPVHRSGGPGLRLHLLHEHGVAEKVLPALRGPLVNVLRHRRRRRDRIDGRHLAEHVSHMPCASVAIPSYEFLFSTHNVLFYMF